MCIPMPLCFLNPLYTCNIQLSFRSKMYTAKECERMLNTKHGTNLFTNRTNAGNTVKIWRLTLFENARSIKHRFMSLLHSLAGICIVCKIQIIQFISHINCFNKALQFKKNRNRGRYLYYIVFQRTCPYFAWTFKEKVMHHLIMVYDCFQ